MKKTERKKCLKERRKGEENEKDEEMDIFFFFFKSWCSAEEWRGPASLDTDGREWRGTPASTRSADFRIRRTPNVPLKSPRPRRCKGSLAANVFNKSLRPRHSKGSLSGNVPRLRTFSSSFHAYATLRVVYRRTFISKSPILRRAKALFRVSLLQTPTSF